MLKTVGFPSLRTGDQTIIDGNLVIGTSGKGIDFSATPGTGTSELLDDYEEGTWTGTLIGSTAPPTTPVTATGKYTKVGNLVTITIAFAGVDTTGATGNIRITGIPFAANSDDNLGTAGLQGFVAVAPIVDVFDSTIAILESGTVNFIAMSAGAGKFVFINATYITP